MKRKPGLKFLALGLAGVLGLGCAALVAGPLLLPEEPLVPAEAIVVLGSGPPVDEAGHPSPELRRRVEQGVKLYRRGLAPKIVMTGGNTFLHYYEADVMREVAVGMGAPESALLLERQATDTITNARGTIDLLCRNKDNSVCAPDLILVSSPYHLQRAKKLFECGGATVQTSASAFPEQWLYRAVYSLHEYQVLFEYLFVDECARVNVKKG